MFNIVSYFGIEDDGHWEKINNRLDKEKKDAIIEDNKGA